MKIILLLIAVMLLMVGADARYSPGLEIAEGANITLDSGHILDSNLTNIKNPSADSDIYVYAPLWRTITVAQWDNGTIIDIDTNSSVVLDNALDACIGGRVLVKDDLSMGWYVDVPNNNTTLELSPGVGLTATASMPYMIHIDPPTVGTDLYGIEITGGTLYCDSKAVDAIHIEGHYGGYTLFDANIHDITIHNAANDAISINATYQCTFENIISRHNAVGFHVEEASVNDRLINFNSFEDTVGCIIGDSGTAPHQRSEGLQMIGPNIVGSSSYAMHIRACLWLCVTNGMFDYSEATTIYFDDAGNNDWSVWNNCYFSPMGVTTGTYIGYGVLMRGTVTHAHFNNCGFVGAWQYGLDMLNSSYVHVNNCMFTLNGRIDTDGGDICNYGSDYVTVMASDLVTATDLQKNAYVETGAGLQKNTILIGNRYLNPVVTNGGTPIKEHNSLVV